MYISTEAVHEMIRTLKSPESVARLQSARESAGNDMLKNMQLVYPLTAQIQIELIPKYGFQADVQGARLYYKHLIILLILYGAHNYDISIHWHYCEGSTQHGVFRKRTIELCSRPSTIYSSSKNL